MCTPRVGVYGKGRFKLGKFGRANAVEGNNCEVFSVGFLACHGQAFLEVRPQRDKSPAKPSVLKVAVHRDKVRDKLGGRASEGAGLAQVGQQSPSDSIVFQAKGELVSLGSLQRVSSAAAFR